MFNYIFVDIETTSLNELQGEVIEISCVDIDGKVLLDEKISFDPSKANQKSLEVNGFYKRASEWDNASSKEEVRVKLKEIFDKPKTVLVAHNVSFEQRWLEHHFGLDFRSTFCTRSMVYLYLDDVLYSTSMKALRYFLNIFPTNSHTSLKDAMDCRKVFITFKLISRSELYALKNDFRQRSGS